MKPWLEQAVKYKGKRGPRDKGGYTVVGVLEEKAVSPAALSEPRHCFLSQCWMCRWSRAGARR